MVLLNAVSFRARNVIVIGLVVLSLSVLTFGANTYYISKSAGADTNSSTQAKSKSSPWAHFPGMASCANNCASYTPVAGDTFILMGCDVWVSSDLPVSWNWSGTSGNPITITVDKSWYNTANCPSSWNRPIFSNPSNTVFSPRNTFMNMAASGATSWLDIRSIEMTGLFCSGACSGNQIYIWCFNSCSNVSISDVYMHAWNIATDGQCQLYGFGASSKNMTVDHAVIDGSDSTTGTCAGFQGVMPSVTNSVIHDLPNGIVGYAPPGTTVTLSGNNIYHITASAAGHINFIETLPEVPATASATYVIHDNALHDQIASGVEPMFIGNQNETDYVFNNIIWNTGNPETGCGNCTAAAAVVFYNNTIVPISGSYCFAMGHPTPITNLTIRNNHCISNVAGSYNGTGVDPALVAEATSSTVDSTNILQGTSSAASQGYGSSETYVYSPSNGSVATIGAGTNLTSVATGNLVALANDTNYACSQQTISGVVQSFCPGRSTKFRSSSGAWDVGAYQYAGASQPTPPTGLAAIVQ